MYLLPWVSINLRTSLVQEQIQQRLADLLEHRTVYWWWETKPKPYIGTVSATSFEVTLNSVYPQTRWMPIVVSGHVRILKEGCSVTLNLQTSKYNLAGVLWAAFALWVLVSTVTSLIARPIAPLMALEFLAVVVAVVGSPYLFFVWAFSFQVDEERTFFSKLLEAKEIK